MTLEQLCTNKDLSQQLKAAGMPQDSVFYWVKFRHSQHGWRLINCDTRDTLFPKYESFSAFTASELGEALLSFPFPAQFETKFYETGFVYATLSFSRGSGYKYPKTRLAVFEKLKKIELKLLKESNTRSEVNARAKLLLYLDKKGLINLKDLCINH